MTLEIQIREHPDCFYRTNARHISNYYVCNDSNKFITLTKLKFKKTYS